MILKRLAVLVMVVFLTTGVSAQITTQKKYQSLLWEISGKGLKKPSHLFGTMHVSSKIAFNLADSFYLGIKNADVVALETNPESWQDDMDKYEQEEVNYDYLRRMGFNSSFSDYLTANSLKFDAYEKMIPWALASSPSVINNLLYRSYGNEASDFEEDTYLDMYIYQCGKKWGKKVAGVEHYGESMKLMMEAYSDAAKEKNKKQRSYEYDINMSPMKLQEAYRSGDLDLLDSINKFNSYSDAFDEKFLYKRNEIQADNIDSIIKSGAVLFVGVGAAHLPGPRGVIEMLREMGYTLRPVKMGIRNSEHKNAVDKIRVPVTFNKQTAEDGMYTVEMPGKLFESPSMSGMFDQRQYADMANGSYYMVTRLQTNSWLWGHSLPEVQKKVDSMLYENIPGRIIQKKTVIKNGYQVVDITNKTRRGDTQRYNIVITPTELIVFKISGNGDYVEKGEEANKFFNSIQLKPAGKTWVNYTPGFGGFSVKMPHTPYAKKTDNWLFDAIDSVTATGYRVVRTDVFNAGFLGDDKFDLSLMDESFATSPFIDTAISAANYLKVGNYPAMERTYKGKQGNLYKMRYIIQGPHYYTLIASGKKEVPQMQEFFQSFTIKPFVYKEATNRVDTSLYFTVKSPVFPESKKEKLPAPKNAYGKAEEETEDDQLENGVYRNSLIANDSTGEKIFVSFYKNPRYYYTADSADVDSEMSRMMKDSSWIVRKKETKILPDKTKVTDFKLGDAKSSRQFWYKNFYKEGVSFAIFTQTDTLTSPSVFLQSFFDSFSPADTLKGYNPYVKKGAVFFEDFFSQDTVVKKRAVNNIISVKMDAADFPNLQKAISSLRWTEKKYMDTKAALISKLRQIPAKEATDYLKNLYYATSDTVDLQYRTLEALLMQGTAYSFNTFRDIVTAEPPVLEFSNKYRSDYDYAAVSIDVATDEESDYSYRSTYADGMFLDNLFDTLALTEKIYARLLPLINLEDYKETILKLTAALVDSNLIKTKDYKSQYSKILLEARHELKKQLISEKRKAIEKAKDAEDEEAIAYGGYIDADGKGNSRLALYNTLLLPYWDKEPAVKQYFTDVQKVSDKRLKYNTLKTLIKNNKPYSDTMIVYFAKQDDYRYELYKDLIKLKKADLFPKEQASLTDLAKSRLLANRTGYNRPDTIAFLQKQETTTDLAKGHIYFFKYKTKKDDLAWKIAATGLVPVDGSNLLLDEKIIRSANEDRYTFTYGGANSYGNNPYSFAIFTDVKLKEDAEEPLAKQLEKEVKKYKYALQKSGSRFFVSEDYGGLDYGQFNLKY
jgi:uncharacterized protein YbaP (TraB family)